MNIILFKYLPSKEFLNSFQFGGIFMYNFYMCMNISFYLKKKCLSIQLLDYIIVLFLRNCQQFLDCLYCYISNSNAFNDPVSPILTIICVNTIFYFKYFDKSVVMSSYSFNLYFSQE